MKNLTFCGADVSKDKIDFCFISENKKAKFYSIPNTYEMLEAFFKSPNTTYAH